MILITLGTQDKQFTRLLDTVQKCIDNKIIKEEVMVQAGCTKYKSKDMKIFDLIPTDEFNKLIEECSLLITHGGVGSIMTGLKNNKKVIAAARLEKYKEHTNDHQKQIVNKLSKEGYILSLDNFDDLGKLINQAKSFEPKEYKSNTMSIVNMIDNYIDLNNTKKKIIFRTTLFYMIFLLFIVAIVYIIV